LVKRSQPGFKGYRFLFPLKWFPSFFFSSFARLIILSSGSAPAFTHFVACTLIKGLHPQGLFHTLPPSLSYRCRLLFPPHPLGGGTDVTFELFFFPGEFPLRSLMAPVSSSLRSTIMLFPPRLLATEAYPPIPLSPELVPRLRMSPRTSGRRLPSSPLAGGGLPPNAPPLDRKASVSSFKTPVF